MLKPLICNADIRKIQSKISITKDELELVFQSNLKEYKIQQRCKKIFDNWCLEQNIDGLFIQIDNGGKCQIGEKVKKKFMGTISGFPDIMILATKGSLKEEIFIEFKRISNPSSMQLKKQQAESHEKLNSIGYKTYLINNTIFFKEILRELLEKLTIN